MALNLDLDLDVLGRGLETQTEMLVEEEPDTGKENNNNFANDQVDRHNLHRV